MKRFLLPALFLAVSVCAPRTALAGEPVPKSYGGSQVYWRWSTEHTEDWYAIPYAQRWMVSEAVVRAFERQGFVWGGKWFFFDTIHFEYRPEILLFSAPDC